MLPDMTGKCPNCKEPVSRVETGTVSANPPVGAKEWRVISFICPHCETVLGVQLHAEVIGEILNALNIKGLK